MKCLSMIFLKKLKSITTIIFVLSVLGFASFLHADQIETALFEQEQASTNIVRAYFNALGQAHKALFRYDTLESEYEKGYLIIRISSAEELVKLQADGFRIEQDTTWFDENITQPALSVSPLAGIPGYSCYATVEETFSDAQGIVSTYPNLATWSDVGDSWEKTTQLGGYDIKVLKLTNRNTSGDKPILFINSAIHAREYATAGLTLHFAKYLVNNYGSDADATWILDHHQVHLMLQTNPDGRKKAESGILWRKNTNQNYCGTTSNSRGADLNRNFSFSWNSDTGSSGSPCSETYRGPSRGSEPETRAVESYISSLWPDRRGSGRNDAAPLDTSGIHFDIHSHGRLILWPWGTTGSNAPNHTQLQTLGRKLAYWNNHNPTRATGLYPADGTSFDPSYGQLGVASITYELGTSFFQSCSYFTNTLIPDNLPSLIYSAKVVRTPYITPAGPDSRSLSLSEGSNSPGVPVGTQITLNAVLDDTRFNNSNGAEPTQNIVSAEYFIDTPPWQTGNSANAMQASDGSFNSKIEGARAAIDTSGLSQGRHIVFVRGRDTAGNDGPISAQFLYISGGGGSSGGSSSGGSSSGGSSSGGSSGGSCTSLQYVAGTSYSTGQLVQNAGSEYRCDIGGWCSSSAAWAYEPGVGMYWNTAWSLNGACGGGSSGGSSSGGGSSGGSSSSGGGSSSGGSSSGGSSSGGSGGGSCAGLSVWSSSSVYVGGNDVQHNGVKYQAKWWTQGQDPAQNSGQWEVWKNNGSCQ